MNKSTVSKRLGVNTIHDIIITSNSYKRNGVMPYFHILMEKSLPSCEKTVFPRRGLWLRLNTPSNNITDKQKVICLD